ncbi:hypothetical protein [Viridibacillus arvi]|uniref:hypothetical protein n=1 Tax=Viridibacillus arvi TaxID=263475 RepID=UPI0034CDA1B7
MQKKRWLMSIEITLLFGAIGTLLGIIGAVAALKKTNKEEGMQDAETKATLNYISKGVDDIRIDQRAQASKLDAYNERLIRVEESTKQAHKRIDTFEKVESK